MRIPFTSLTLNASIYRDIVYGLGAGLLVWRHPFGVRLSVTILCFTLDVDLETIVL